MRGDFKNEETNFRAEPDAMLNQDSPSAFDQMDFPQDIPDMMDQTNKDFNKVVFGENQFDFADLAADEDQIHVA